MALEGDILKLCGLEVECVIGDLPEERERPGRVVVDVALETDFREAAEKDVLSGTVDYAALARAVRTALEKARCRLIERAAAIVAEVCLEDARVRAVEVEVRKSGCVDGLAFAAARTVRRRP